MTPDAKKKLIGAIVAAALAIAVFYGLIDQKQANSIQDQTNQTLGTGPAQQQQQQPAPQTTQAPTAPQPANPPASPPPAANPAPANPPAPAPQPR